MCAGSLPSPPSVVCRKNTSRATFCCRRNSTTAQVCAPTIRFLGKELAREAEIALATMAMITDYDCWKVEEEPVSAQTVFGHLTANAEAAKKVLLEVIPRIPADPGWADHRSLDSALVTERKLWPKATAEKLRPILGRFL